MQPWLQQAQNCFHNLVPTALGSLLGIRLPLGSVVGELARLEQVRQRELEEPLLGLELGRVLRLPGPTALGLEPEWPWALERLLLPSSLATSPVCLGVGRVPMKSLVKRVVLPRPSDRPANSRTLKWFRVDFSRMSRGPQT